MFPIGWIVCLQSYFLGIFSSINILDPWGALWINAQVALWLSRIAQSLCSGSPIPWLVNRLKLTLIISFKNQRLSYDYLRVLFFFILSQISILAMVSDSWGKTKEKTHLSTILVMMLMITLFCSEISTSGRFPSIHIEAKQNTIKLGACGLLRQIEFMRS